MILDRPEEPGKKYALAFTILVHVGLLVVLFFGVQWKRSAPEVMEVELWSAKPAPATYVPPPPPPEPEVKPEPKPVVKAEPKPEPLPPKAPDIVVREEKKKPEPKKVEPKPEPPKPEPKKPEPKPETKKPEPVKPEVTPPKFDFNKELSRETSELRSKNNPSTRQLANAAAAESEQRASSNRRGLADYANKIRIQIRSNIVLPPNIQGNPEAVFEVNQLPTREILSVKLKRSSGNQALDEAIERAIRKSSPLPSPDDPSLFKRDLEIKYKPFEE